MIRNADNLLHPLLATLRMILGVCDSNYKPYALIVHHVTMCVTLIVNYALKSNDL